MLKADEIKLLIQKDPEVSKGKKSSAGCCSLCCNVRFFAYNSSNIQGGGASICRCQFMFKFLLYLAILGGVGFFIFIYYWDKLGAQMLSFSKMQRINEVTIPTPPIKAIIQYDINDVSKRMNCKDGCQKERCESLGDMTSLVYEDCMIKYQDDTKTDGGNATKFCVDLYQDLSLWKNELNSYTAAFNERKYSCLKKAGSPNGREQCEQLKVIGTIRTNDDFLICLRKNNAKDHQKDFCSKFYDQKDEDYLLCLLENGSAYDEEYCEIRFKDDKKKRLKCFDNLGLKSFNICNQKDWTKEVDGRGLTSCVKDSNGDQRCDLDENHVRKQCVKRYVNQISNPNSSGYKNALQKDPDLKRGMESYRCYPQDQVEGILAMTNMKDPETSAISIYDAFDPVETDVAIHKPHDIKECYEVFAKNNVADRDFCIEHTSTKDDRKQCLDNVRVPIDRAFCETFNLNDADAKYACLEGILDEQGNQIDYKAEYCHWNYFQPEQYEEKWECLLNQSKYRDSEYCKDKFGYIKYFKPKEYKIQDEVNCYFELGFPMNKQECKLMNSKLLQEYDQREDERKAKLAELEAQIEAEEKYGIPLINYYDNAVDKRKFMSFKSIVVSDKDDKKLNRVTLYKNKDKATLKDTGKMFTELFGVTSFEYKKKKKTKARYAWINQETIIVQFYGDLKSKKDESMEKRFKYKEYIETPKSKSYKGPHYVWQETDENNNILEEGLKLWVAEKDAKLKSSSYKNSYAQEPFNSTELCVFSARKDSETQAFVKVEFLRESMINSIQLFNPVAFNDNQKLKYFKDRENISYLDGAQVSIGTQLCGAIKTTPENSNRMITVDCGGKQGKSVSIMQTLEYAYDIPICGLVVNGKHVELEEKKVEPPVEEPQNQDETTDEVPIEQETFCSEEDTNCGDGKTCILRYIAAVSDASSQAYVAALEADAGLQLDATSYLCKKNEKVDSLVASSGVEEATTTITAHYIKAELGTCTGLPKDNVCPASWDCVYRYTNSIANPNSPGYINAFNKDPTLAKGEEVIKCYYQSKAQELMALNNIKDPVTTVTMSYRIIPKPEPPAVDEITTDEAPADTSEPPADGAARRRRILYTKMQNTTTDDVSEKQPDLQSRKSRNLVEDKLIDQHTELVQKSIPPELLDCEQTNEQLHEACEEAFQAPEYVNDHFNCIEKFGMKRGPFFCIQTEGFVMDSFEYNLKHKYSCLRRFTQLVMDPDVQWCYEKTVNYLIEQCLTEYEDRVDLVDFTLKEGVAEGQEHYDESEVISYGAKKIEDKNALPKEEDNSALEKYICENAKVSFQVEDKMEFKCRADFKEDGVMQVEFSNTITQQEQNMTMSSTTNAQLDVSLPDLIPVKSKSLELLGEKFDSFNIGLVVQPIKQIHRNVRVPISLTIPYFEYKIEIEKAYSFGWDPKDRIMSSLSVLESQKSDEFSMQVDFFEDQTVIQHFTIIDILEDVGGLWALCTLFLTIFFGFLILVYICDLVKFIRANYVNDLEYYKVIEKMEKLQKLVKSNPKNDVQNIKITEVLQMYNKEMHEKPSSMQKFNIAIDECLSKESQGLRRQSTKTGKPRINKGADAHVLYLENIIERTNSFFSVVNLIRKRVSFYGVYKAHDSIDLVLLKINMARKLLRKIKEQMYQSQVKTQSTFRNTKDGSFEFLANVHDGIKDNSDRNIEEVTRLQLMVDDIKTHIHSNDYQNQSRMKMDDTQNISGFYGSQISPKGMIHKAKLVENEGEEQVDLGAVELEFQ